MLNGRCDYTTNYINIIKLRYECFVHPTIVKIFKRGGGSEKQLFGGLIYVPKHNKQLNLNRRIIP